MDGLIDGEVVKVDIRGRVQIKPERREALMAEFSRSGMNGQQFAKWAGVKYSTFASWRRKQEGSRRSASGEGEVTCRAPDMQWVEAVVRGAEKSPSLVIEVGTGVRLSVKDVGQARLAGVLLRELMAGGKSC